MNREDKYQHFLLLRNYLLRIYCDLPRTVWPRFVKNCLRVHSEQPATKCFTANLSKTHHVKQANMCIECMSFSDANGKCVVLCWQKSVYAK